MSEIDENKEKIVLKAINEAINNRQGRLAFSSDGNDDILLSEIDHLSKVESEMTTAINSRKIRQASVIARNNIENTLGQMGNVCSPDGALSHLEAIEKTIDPLIKELKEVLTEAANLK